jgi:hypothetical protein
VLLLCRSCAASFAACFLLWRTVFPVLGAPIAVHRLSRADGLLACHRYFCCGRASRFLRQPADDDYDPLFAAGAAPLWFRRWSGSALCLCFPSSLFKKQSQSFQGYSVSRTPEAVIAHLVEPLRKDVLERRRNSGACRVMVRHSFVSES